MKLIYMGTPEFAVTILEGLIQAGHDIEAVERSWQEITSTTGGRVCQGKWSEFVAAGFH